MDQLAAWIEKLPVWSVYLLLGLIALITSRKSQFDEWAESQPRLAGLMKIVRGFGPDAFLIRQAITLLLLGRLPIDREPLPEKEPKSKRSLPPGAGVLMLALSCGMIVGSPILLNACGASQATKAQMVEAGKALAFNSAATALVLLDKAESERHDAIKNPTEAQEEQAKKNVTKLRAVRDSLQLVRDWMLGQNQADGPKLIRDALVALRSVADAIEAEGGALPPEVDQLLEAGRGFL